MQNRDENLGPAFAALAHPTRLRLVGLLRERPATVSELKQRARLSQPTVSKHLRVLQDAGLVASGRNAKDGRSRVYWLRPEPFNALTLWAVEIAELRQPINAALVTDRTHIPRERRRLTTRGTERVRRRYFHTIEDEHEARDHYDDVEYRQKELEKELRRDRFERILVKDAARRAISRQKRFQQYD